jgi:hypothetical protein
MVLEVVVVLVTLAVSVTLSVWVGKTAEAVLAQMRRRWPAA